MRLVGEKGPKWTEIGASLNRTAYVCQAAYKRLVHKSIGDPPSPLPVSTIYVLLFGLQSIGSYIFRCIGVTRW